jgi:hypothetical protein
MYRTAAQPNKWLEVTPSCNLSNHFLFPGITCTESLGRCPAGLAAWVYAFQKTGQAARHRQPAHESHQ